MNSGGSVPNAPGGRVGAVAAVVPLVPAWRIDRTFDYAIPQALEDKVVRGSLVRVPFGHRRVRGIVTAVGNAPPDDGLEAIVSVSFPVPVAPGPICDLLEWAARRYVAPRGRSYALSVPPRVRVAAPTPERLSGGPPPASILDYEGGAELIGAIEGGRAGPWCLRARPGEDHGRVIAELVAAAGRAGSGAALVMVPEVRYGSAVVDELERWWPAIARVESTRDDMDRARALAALGRGHGLGAGGRAAVLAPAPEIRLIVVDDEHHRSYKEDRSPRYDARRMATERCRLQRAVCVFVSAAPTVELGAAAASGRVGTVVPRRADLRAARPIVELVDRPDERALSHELHERVRDALRAGRRVALLAPQRGWARSLWCAECRRSLRCPVCEAGMLFDRTPLGVRCARCGYSSTPPGACPSCGGDNWRFVGAGSERLAEHLGVMFPRARVRRVDPAVLEGLDETPSFEDAEIYLTTWVGTKASLRPDVSVVGILDADALIRRPDFRAAERAYQALAEMSEWAGPASAGGRLVVQTLEPAHHTLQALARGDYGYFLRRELEHRKELSYPPFSEIVKVAVVGDEADSMLDRIAGAAARHRARVLGPIPRRPRYDAPGGLEILIKCRVAAEIADELRLLVPSAPAGTRVIVDVDPL